MDMKQWKDVLHIVSGKNQKSVANPNGQYPIYGSGGIMGYADEYLCEAGTTIVGRKGTINHPIYVNERFWNVDTAFGITPDAELDSKYLFYFCQSFNFKSLDKSTTIPSLAKTDLLTIEMPVPSLPEQERIVSRIEELFSQLDAGVETLKKTKAELAVYRQAVLREAFEGKLTEEWRAKQTNLSIGSYCSEILSMKEQSGNLVQYQLDEPMNLCELPAGWKWMYIGDITSGPEYGTSQKSLKEGKVPVIRMGNLQNGEIDWGDLAYSNDDEEIEKYKLKPNTVLFNRTNSPEHVGKTAIYRGGRDAIFAGYLIRINQFDLINPEYLNYYMNSFTARTYANKVKTDGVNQSNINGKKLCSYPFPICTREEQDLIVYELSSRLSVCDSIEQTVDTALQQAEAMRQSILKDAFEGRL